MLVLPVAILLISSGDTVLKANTRLELTLNTILSSFPDQMEFRGTPKAGSKEGDPVSMLVAKDVVDSGGNVLIKAGTPVEGKVRFARLGKVLVSWPRIYVSVDSVKSADGTTVPLKGSVKDVWNGPAFEFTQQNTINYIPKELIELAMKKRKPTDAEVAAMVALTAVTIDGVIAVNEAMRVGKQMESVLKPWGLSNTFQSPTNIVGQQIAIIGLTWVLGAAIADATKTHSALDKEYLNNILAWPGTPMSGFVAKDTTLTTP